LEAVATIGILCFGQGVVWGGFCIEGVVSNCFLEGLVSAITCTRGLFGGEGCNTVLVSVPVSRGAPFA
jgi:hypothetical protein